MYNFVYSALCQIKVLDKRETTLYVTYSCTSLYYKDRLERVHCQAARFIKRDYRTRETGWVGHMLQELNLPPLQERRKQQRLTTLYKIVKGHIPAMPPENFLMPVDRNRWRIHLTTLRIAVMTTPPPRKKFETLVAWRFQTARLSSVRTHSL